MAATALILPVTLPIGLAIVGVGGVTSLTGVRLASPPVHRKANLRRFINDFQNNQQEDVIYNDGGSVVEYRNNFIKITLDIIKNRR